ncbi:myb-like DNA-binding protein [Achlya hypogyna]|uniref:Myb-like DNA-binding protein n=1 Tax=Achlya hypogyna TaxID=1202772 RepID=A0A1V9YP70_ACHHY|nr:myb-like DNA-binding protein [Achlya hypogyna]
MGIHTKLPCDPGNMSPRKHRKTTNEGKGTWTLEEHERFLQASKLYPFGPWKVIASMVRTRNVRQTQTHAQKFREKIARRDRGLRRRKKQVGPQDTHVRRPSIDKNDNDTTSENHDHHHAHHRHHHHIHLHHHHHDLICLPDDKRHEPTSMTPTGADSKVKVLDLKPSAFCHLKSLNVGAVDLSSNSSEDGDASPKEAKKPKKKSEPKKTIASTLATPKNVIPDKRIVVDAVPCLEDCLDFLIASLEHDDNVAAGTDPALADVPNILVV